MEITHDVVLRNLRAMASTGPEIVLAQEFFRVAAADDGFIGHFLTVVENIGTGESHLLSYALIILRSTLGRLTLGATATATTAARRRAIIRELDAPVMLPDNIQAELATTALNTVLALLFNPLPGDSSPAPAPAPAAAPAAPAAAPAAGPARRLAEDVVTVLVRTAWPVLLREIPGALERGVALGTSHGLWAALRVVAAAGEGVGNLLTTPTLTNNMRECANRLFVTLTTIFANLSHSLPASPTVLAPAAAAALRATAVLSPRAGRQPAHDLTSHLATLISSALEAGEHHAAACLTAALTALTHRLGVAATGTLQVAHAARALLDALPRLNRQTPGADPLASATMALGTQLITLAADDGAGAAAAAVEAVPALNNDNRVEYFYKQCVQPYLLCGNDVLGRFDADPAQQTVEDLADAGEGLGEGFGETAGDVGDANIQPARQAALAALNAIVLFDNVQDGIFGAAVGTVTQLLPALLGTNPASLPLPSACPHDHPLLVLEAALAVLPLVIPDIEDDNVILGLLTGIVGVLETPSIAQLQQCNAGAFIVRRLPPIIASAWPSAAALPPGPAGHAGLARAALALAPLFAAPAPAVAVADSLVTIDRNATASSADAADRALAPAACLLDPLLEAMAGAVAAGADAVTAALGQAARVVLTHAPPAALAASAGSIRAQLAGLWNGVAAYRAGVAGSSVILSAQALVTAAETECRRTRRRAAAAPADADAAAAAVAAEHEGRETGVVALSLAAQAVQVAWAPLERVSLSLVHDVARSGLLADSSETLVQGVLEVVSVVAQRAADPIVRKREVETLIAESFALITAAASSVVIPPILCDIFADELSTCVHLGSGLPRAPTPELLITALITSGQMPGGAQHLLRALTAAALQLLGTLLVPDVDGAVDCTLATASAVLRAFVALGQAFGVAGAGADAAELASQLSQTAFSSYSIARCRSSLLIACLSAAHIRVCASMLPNVDVAAAEGSVDLLATCIAQTSHTTQLITQSGVALFGISLSMLAPTLPNAGRALATLARAAPAAAATEVRAWLHTQTAPQRGVQAVACLSLAGFNTINE